jgi:hypothetical protein
MANKKNKQLVLDTLLFFIKQRNIALFRLNSFQSKKGSCSEEKEKAQKIVENLRFRLIHELDKNKHLLSDEERGRFVKDNEYND